MTINQEQLKIWEQAQKDTGMSINEIALYWCKSGMAKEFRKYYEQHNKVGTNV